MKIGFNVTGTDSYKIATELAERKAIDFVEILIDNFTHLDPHAIAERLSSLEIGFHIMKSEFIERGDEELKSYSTIIREFSEILRPLYISDHLARFNIHGKSLPITAEIDYLTEYKKVVGKVHQWQEMLGTTILLENFPSRLSGSSANQVQFFGELIQETQCGILFDISNAVVADINGGVNLSEWKKLKPHCKNFHVAGYRSFGNEGPGQWIIDSHDTNISDETLEFAGIFFKDFIGNSIVIERDANLDLESIFLDIQQIRKVVA